MTTTDLRNLGRWVNLSALFRACGLSGSRTTMFQAIRRGRPLTDDESDRLTSELRLLRDELDRIL